MYGMQSFGKAKAQAKVRRSRRDVGAKDQVGLPSERHSALCVHMEEEFAASDTRCASRNLLQVHPLLSSIQHHQTRYLA